MINTIEIYDYIKHKYKIKYYNLFGSCMEHDYLELSKHIIMNGLYNSSELHETVLQFEQFYPNTYYNNKTYMYLKFIDECDV